MSRYDDIIHLPHHVSQKRPQMSRENRAAQFSPFAALTGLGAAMVETARLTEQKIDLDEHAQGELDECFRVINERLIERPEVTVTYFVPDERKSGGAYVTATGRVKKLDQYGQELVLEDGTVIPLENIYAIGGTLFER